MCEAVFDILVALLFASEIVVVIFLSDFIGLFVVVTYILRGPKALKPLLLINPYSGILGKSKRWKK